MTASQSQTFSTTLTDTIQDRIHPAESRIRKLASETPALLILFDCLATAPHGSLIDAPLTRRRAALERVAAQLGHAHRTRLSPFTLQSEAARRWLEDTSGGLDGVIAKRVDAAYAAGERVMLKVKRLRSADCVIGAAWVIRRRGKAEPRRVHLSHRQR
jgi:ATP-dependent DNA ligase